MEVESKSCSVCFFRPVTVRDLTEVKKKKKKKQLKHAEEGAKCRRAVDKTFRRPLHSPIPGREESWSSFENSWQVHIYVVTEKTL